MRNHKIKGFPVLSSLELRFGIWTLQAFKNYTFFMGFEHIMM